MPGHKKGKNDGNQHFYLSHNVFNPINPLPDDKILDWSKLKQIADDILNCIYNGKEVPYRVKNIVRKGENACYKQKISFSHIVFHSYISLVHQNAVLCGNGLKPKCII